MKRKSVAVALLAGSAWAAPVVAQQATDDIAPEVSSEAAGETAFAGLSQGARDALTSKSEGKPVTAQNWMVAAANPLAVEAGARILEQGGSAADAMVAVQTVLGLVEPQSSGLGGGAFLVWYDAESGKLTTLDARETAPLAATPTYFQDENGEPLEFFDAVVGGRSVGTPGTPALLEAAHRRWGKANWGSLFEDAIELAEDGFEVSPRLAGLVAEDSDRLGRFPATKAYFFPDGNAIAAGATLRNPDYAHVLRRLATEGSDAFYTGEIAEGIVDTVRSAEGNPGLLSAEDLARYRVIERPAVCAEYRDHDICGMGPPSSGALTVGQILGMLGGYDLAALGAENPESWRLIGDASRLAFADRGRYMADSDFVPVPTEGLVAPDYLSERGKLLSGDDALPEVSAGSPGWSHAMLWGQDSAIEFPSTSHISIVDADGNALSMTTTIENGFGSRLFTQGFLLNNELTDFSFETHDDAGYPIANRLEPGKRPRSSMAPSIVMKDDRPVLVIGSPGGSRIIGYVAKAIIGHLDWGLDVQQAIALPNVVNRFGAMDVEAGTDAAALTQPLTDLGFEVNETDLTSGLHGIAITPEGLSGGADPRREGIALGG
ncbi:gamma-glutamyltransferase [Paracoccus sp. R12_1]|uniref:gamma-glutamyltransferase n=1 Tax=unclassified Paracoccus (in: a-proteobacteria) TaxID=2688777 RepID=UPI001AD95917|nr:MULTISPECIES: gamma-glutamyltransferase [unclassified Paracoccus (in: a-proteobacteria)]MBO9455384.1 gamma-glutamyltransferase [Paracoccus sp. R12_2]MBO9485864.1 gamma-glutamyltransferase [Paracoccus sp. R12_1]